MAEKIQPINYEPYSESIETLKDILQNKLGTLGIESAIFFGSSTFGDEYFTKGVSDLDVCAFTNQYNGVQTLSEITNSLNNEFLDKPPVILNDYIADRIEFYVELPEISADITIMSPGLPRLDQVHKSASHDSLELLFANFYQHGVPIIGEIPDYENTSRNFLPFYDNDLRRTRLNTLEKRIHKHNQKTSLSMGRHNGDTLDNVYKSREYFLKWLFIYNRTYPLCLRKHLDNQLKDLLGLSLEEREVLQFNGSGNMRDQVHNYLALSDKYLKTASEEL